MPQKGEIYSNYPRTSTGVLGISLVRTRKHHRTALRSYFSVHYRTNGKPHNRTFCIETLGKAEAWRRALVFRQEYLNHRLRGLNR